MRLRHTILLFALLYTAKAKAQLGLYGTFTGSGVSRISAPYPFSGTSSFWAIGAGAGIYDDFAKIGPVHLGVDLRGNILHSQGHQLDSVLGGIRLAFKAPATPIKPYVQASVGVANTNYGVGSTTTRDLQYQLFGGLDFTIFPRVDWRLVEVGVGALHGTVGNNTTYPVVTASTGLVFRIP